MSKNKIQVELHGSRCGLSDDGDMIVDNRIVAGTAKNRVRFFDDFLGDVIADQWAVVEGADTSTSDAAVVSGVGGMLRLTTGDSATATYAGNGIQVTHGAFYNWKAENGGLRFETRIKLSAITTCALFVGFTDLGTFEAPIESAGSGNTITTNATDAVGIMFDTRMTADNFWGVGVKNDVDATAVNLGVAPVAATYITLAIEIGADERANFFINGALVGSTASAVTKTVLLTPTIAATSLLDTLSITLDADYVDVEMYRV